MRNLLGNILRWIAFKIDGKKLKKEDIVQQEINQHILKQLSSPR